MGNLGLSLDWEAAKRSNKKGKHKDLNDLDHQFHFVAIGQSEHRNMCEIYDPNSNQISPQDCDLFMIEMNALYFNSEAWCAEKSLCMSVCVSLNVYWVVCKFE